MKPLQILDISLECMPGRPALATVVLTGGLVLSQIRIWPARHGPLVQFPLGTGARSQLEISPVLRTLLVKALVATWRRDQATRSRAAA
ncbi:MAG: hypothetical protein IPK50_23410 [Fibrobacterota bacterium]|nr:hypothetical protein [Fibrobacterota bacterium]QQS05182.1 MAG: hypothetical protein IPK50_23410 [Fibrobacterota bacterium]